MDMFLDYLIVFAVGGAVCAIAQLLINLTKFTAAKILVTFLLLGVVLEAIGVFDYIKDFAKAGVTVPIIGFGSVMTKGTLLGLKEKGLLGVLLGGLSAGAVGISAAIFFGFLMAIIFKSKTKT